MRIQYYIHSYLSDAKSLCKLYALLVPIISLVTGCNNDVEQINIEVNLKHLQEETLNNNKLLTSSTQSINRHHSVLLNYNKALFNYNEAKKTIGLSFDNEGKQLEILNVKSAYLLPLLPYNHENEIDDFDKANLLLAEFARNGVNMSHQNENSLFGYFYGSKGLFNNEPEFQFINNEVIPNRSVKPRRFSVVNNCLNPGLWELSASDAVGEMFHAWFTLPPEFYFKMIKIQNNISNSNNELQEFFKTSEKFENIDLQLDRLRDVKETVLKSSANIAVTKEIGGYSTQDSRRKVQRQFYKILREKKGINISNFGELQSKDVFSLYTFKPPGIYSAKDRIDIPFNPDWKHVKIKTVEPQTTYKGEHSGFDKYGYIELELFSGDESRSIIAGNIPVQLLVESADYHISSFGAGVLNASEFIERRYLRMKEGPYPHYAYLVNKENGKDQLLNNHTVGYEQLIFRPFYKEKDLYLRMTVVSYERIIDLLEFEIHITGPLKEKIQQASSEYQSPIYTVYQDSNIL